MGFMKIVVGCRNSKIVRDCLKLALLPWACLFVSNVVFAYQNLSEDLNSRIRIVPQSSDGLMTDIEENKNGTRLVTHDRNNAPRLWDARRRLLLGTLSGHLSAVNEVKFSDSGAQLLTRSSDRIRLWDSQRSTLLFEYLAPPGEKWNCVSQSASTEEIAFGSSSGKVYIALKGSKSLKALSEKLRGEVTCMSFSDDGKYLAVGGTQNGLVLQVPTYQPIIKSNEKMGSSLWTVFSPDSKWLAITTNRNCVDLYSLKLKKLVVSYRHFIGSRGISTEFCGACFVGKKTTQLLTSEENGDLVLQPLDEGGPVNKLTGHTGEVREIRVSFDRQFIATYGDDNKMKLWDVASRKEIPIKDLPPGLPTAADFSPSRPIFWVGYSGSRGGSICQLNVLSGQIESNILGSVNTLRDMSLSTTEPILMLSDGADQRVFMDLRFEHRPSSLWLKGDDFSPSPNGRYYIVKNASYEFPNTREFGSFLVADPFSNLLRFIRLKNVVNADFSSDSSKIAMVNVDRDASVFDVQSGKRLNSWRWNDNSTNTTFSNSIQALNFVSFSADGTSLLTYPHNGNKFHLWEWESGKEIKSFQGPETTFTHYEVTGNRRFAVFYAKFWIEVYDLEIGERIYKYQISGDRIEHVQVSNNGKILFISTLLGIKVVSIDKGVIKEWESAVGALSQDGKMYAVGSGTTLITTIFDSETHIPLAKLRVKDTLRTVLFPSQSDRFLTLDDNGGVTVWKLPKHSSSNSPSAKLLSSNVPEATRLCQVVVINNSEWLVYDENGRYDAPDPSAVSGAYFVLNWKDGLEAISMPQLKSLFYEPGLFSKCMGIDPEPVRDVPTLENLKLYPEVILSKGNGLSINVRLRERDEGGIGTVKFFLNGKQILQRRGVGYFQVDLASYISYFLPQTLLPEGKGNELTVQVQNQKGDLVSPLERLDLGIPEGLKPPPVRLHALFVGAGDYVGQEYDLQAPPYDAEALASALQEVAGRLLPSRISIATLTTQSNDPANRPTRKNIVNWFEKVRKEASSSDVVLVFFAGHGVEKIGDSRDYFFLTCESNPSDVTASSVGTTTISGEDLKKLLASLPANKQVVILDTCHSGAASGNLIDKSRSVSGDYQRAWESIRESTGTWMLAGASADQKSYESTNVDHGMLTYALLEAIDQATPEALRTSTDGFLFVDVEKWLGFAATRVETLKNEVGIRGLQRPEFRKSSNGASFDIGVMRADSRGFLKLKAPMPVVIIGAFEQDQEDPLGMDALISTAMKSASSFKPWFDRPKHPNVYRVAGTYSVSSDVVSVKVVIQKFDSMSQRKTLETHEVRGILSQLGAFSERIKDLVETRIKSIESKMASSRSN
jgi:WD40 repeat protein